MAIFTGRYILEGGGRGPDLQGPCQLSFDDSTLTLAGAGTPPLAVDLGDIDAFQPGEYELRLVLYTGQVLVLRQFGKSFQDLERELREAYRDRLVQCLLVSDLSEVARFTGRIQLDSPRRPTSGPGEIRLYDSNIAILPDAAPGFQWRLADVTSVDFDERDYAVVLRRGHERLAIAKLAKRTTELADRVRQGVLRVQERSARTLRALFPFLSPDQFRQVAALMPEGTSAAIVRLRSIHPLIEPSLLEKVVLGSLRPYVSSLLQRATSDGWYAGFKIVRQTEESGVEEAGEEEPGATEAGADESSQSDGVDLRPLDPEVTDVGDGLVALYWFFVPVAANRGGAASHLAWEATSDSGRATYVFRKADAATAGAGLSGAVSCLNDGLVAINFRREPVYLATQALEGHLRYRHYAIAMRKVPEVLAVRRAFVGRGMHTTPGAWEKQIDRHLAS